MSGWAQDDLFGGAPVAVSAPVPPDEVDELPPEEDDLLAFMDYLDQERGSEDEEPTGEPSAITEVGIMTEGTLLATMGPVEAPHLEDGDVLTTTVTLTLTEGSGVPPKVDSIGHQQAGMFSLEEVGGTKPAPGLADKFVVPPFSVLDTQAGYWRERKRAWLDLGIASEVGRGESLMTSGKTNLYEGKAEWLGNKGPSVKKRLTYVQGDRPVEEMDETSQKILATGSGTSIFDPVVCEIVYRWFSPPGAMWLDPFAGGSVRGIVAAALGMQYVGVELRPEQVEANRQQWLDIRGKLPAGSPQPEWIQGDSAKVLPTLKAESFDGVFSCPPYADLEVYSDDPDDLSTMPYERFNVAHAAIIAAAVRCLKPHRFAVWVIGEGRGPDGCYYGLVPDSVVAFRAAGCRFHNEGVLRTAIGSTPVRTSFQFPKGRKFGKVHQNILGFVKGDPDKAARAMAPMEVQWT